MAGMPPQLVAQMRMKQAELAAAQQNADADRGIAREGLAIRGKEAEGNLGAGKTRADAAMLEAQARADEVKNQTTLGNDPFTRLLNIYKNTDQGPAKDALANQLAHEVKRMQGAGVGPPQVNSLPAVGDPNAVIEQAFKELEVSGTTDPQEIMSHLSSKGIDPRTARQWVEDHRQTATTGIIPMIGLGPLSWLAEGVGRGASYATTGDSYTYSPTRAFNELQSIPYNAIAPGKAAKARTQAKRVGLLDKIAPK
jgi:hypothetical protein